MATHEIRLVRTVSLPPGAEEILTMCPPLEFATVKVDYDDSLVEQLSHNLDTTNGSIPMQLAKSYIKQNGWSIEADSTDAKHYSSSRGMWEIDSVVVENNSNLYSYSH